MKNEARKVVTEFLEDELKVDCTPAPGFLTAADLFLAWLWAEGYKIVPLNPDMPALP